MCYYLDELLGSLYLGRRPLYFNSYIIRASQTLLNCDNSTTVSPYVRNVCSFDSYDVFCIGKWDLHGLGYLHGICSYQQQFDVNKY